MRPDVARAGEPSRIVDGDFEGERYERTDTRGGHQKATDRIHAHDAQDLPVQCGTVLKHGIADLEQRVYGSLQQAILTNYPPPPRLECCAPVSPPRVLPVKTGNRRELVRFGPAPSGPSANTAPIL